MLDSGVDMCPECEKLTIKLNHALAAEARANERFCNLLDRLAMNIATAPEGFYSTLDREGWFKLAKSAGMRPPKKADLGKVKEKFENLNSDDRAEAIGNYLSGIDKDGNLLS